MHFLFFFSVITTVSLPRINLALCCAFHLLWQMYWCSVMNYSFSWKDSLKNNFLFLNCPLKWLKTSSKAIGRHSHFPLIKMTQGFAWHVLFLQAYNKPDFEHRCNSAGLGKAKYKIPERRNSKTKGSATEAHFRKRKKLMWLKQFNDGESNEVRSER